MTRTAHMLLACALLAVPAARGDMGGYSTMEIGYIGELTGGFDGAFEQMTGGVEITLRADDPELEPLPIKARTMRFEYEAGDANPARIHMEGGVNVHHPTAWVQSDTAVWDFAQGEMTFTGNVIMNSDRMKDVRAQALVLDFETDRYRMTGVQAEEVSLPRDEAETPRGLLTDDDVRDWTGLVTTFRRQAADPAPSPGRRIHTLLDPDAQRILADAPVDSIVANRELFLRQLNAVLHNPELHDEAAWAGADPGPEAQDLLDRETRSAREQIRLNRLLLHAAYPDHIAAP